MKNSIDKGVSYIEGKIEGFTRPYTMALAAFALSMADSRMKLRANEILTQHAIYDAGEFVGSFVYIV